jgi:hypothetical protein
VIDVQMFLPVDAVQRYGSAPKVSLSMPAAQFEVDAQGPTPPMRSTE